MTQYVCDRCGTVSNKRLQEVTIPQHDDKYRHTQIEKVKDLCPECMYQFVEWMQPLPKAAK
jgi:hypothetical protein